MMYAFIYYILNNNLLGARLRACILWSSIPNALEMGGVLCGAQYMMIRRWIPQLHMWSELRLIVILKPVKIWFNFNEKKMQPREEKQNFIFVDTFNYN